MAKLLATLHDQDISIFTVQDAVRILGGDPATVSNLLGKSEGRGVVTRLRRGTYIIVPATMGSEPVYAGDPLLVADRLMGDRPHYLSHGTAMAIHGMTVQPRILVTISCTSPTARSISAQGTEIRVVGIRAEEIFGLEKHWLEPGVSVMTGDPERTVVDCLRRPDLCGGYPEIDLGAWMQRDKLDPEKLVNYAVRLGIGAVCGRLGYLMDSCRLGNDDHRKMLRQYLSRAYSLLDPSMSKGGRYASDWKLQLNINEDEIEALRST